VVGYCEAEGPSVATRKQLVFTPISTVPHGSNGVRNDTDRQVVTRGHLHLADARAAERATLGEKVRSRGAVDRTVDHAATT
jgi:hypothetical protein